MWAVNKYGKEITPLAVGGGSSHFPYLQAGNYPKEGSFTVFLKSDGKPFELKCGFTAGKSKSLEAELLDPTGKSLFRKLLKPGKKGGVDFSAVWENIGWMLGCYVVSALLAYVLSVVMLRLSQRIIYKMRKQVFEKLMTLPVNFFDTHATGDIISHLSYDIDTINSTLSHDLVQILTSAYTVVGSLLFMWQISKPMILIFALMMFSPAMKRTHEIELELEKQKLVLESRKNARTALLREVHDLERSPEAIEKIARERFNMCREGEIVIKYDR